MTKTEPREKEVPTTGCLRCPQRVPASYRRSTSPQAKKLCRDCRYVLGRAESKRYVA